MRLQDIAARHKTIAADGAMGTYFSKLTGKEPGACELQCILDPEVIRRIHKEYIQAGAKLIRTNTFSVNSLTGGFTREESTQIITSAWNIASGCAGNDAVVCADVSAIYSTAHTEEEILDEYRCIIDTFLSCGAQTFIFETLSELDAVLPAIRYLHNVMPDAEIITSFTILPDGKTRSGISYMSIAEDIAANAYMLTAAGLNCGCGALQLLPNAVPFFSYIRSNTNLYTIVMPNAGYPSIENRRTVFTSTPRYFAEQASRFIDEGISVIGGCCGTEPEFIELLSDRIVHTVSAINRTFPSPDAQKSLHISGTAHKNTVNTASSRFHEKLENDRFVIAAELDPPNTHDLSRLINAAGTLKSSGVDIITVSDSPLGHAKMDPVVCSARIKREVGIEVLPHICCRDRNINAVRSILLGAYSEGIRSVLAVTGDHIAETDRGVIKPVFNMDSVKLMNLISRLNESVFTDDPIIIGGAYDPEQRKLQFALDRLGKKKKAGASFVLTQPVFSKDAVHSIDKAREQGVKVLVGIMPMVSYRNANFMKNEVPGMYIPDDLIKRFSPDMTREEATETGISVAAELAEMMLPHADGFYFVTPFNRAEVIGRVIEKLREADLI